MASGAPAPVTGVGGAGAPVLRLTERERYLLSIILEYRMRGWGTYRIGRVVFKGLGLGGRTAQKRVQRLLDKARRAGIPVDDPERALALLWSRPTNRGAVETGVSTFARRSRRRVGEDGGVETARALPRRGLGGPPRRLGRTQRLVLAALASLGGMARFSAIVREALGLLGLEAYTSSPGRWRNRVWQALRRLARRGIVGFHRGVYWLSPGLGGPGLYVENFRATRVDGRAVDVWVKRRGGYAAPLDYALALATLRGAVRTLQVEVAEILEDPELEELMDELDVSLIKIYRDPDPPYRLRAKLEVAFSRRTPLKPSILELSTWTKAFQTIKQALLRSLRTR